MWFFLKNGNFRLQNIILKFLGIQPKNDQFWPWKWWYSNQKPIKERSPTDNFIILGCDGIFDVLNSTQLLQMTFGKWCFYIFKRFKDFSTYPFYTLDSTGSTIVRRALRKDWRTRFHPGRWCNGPGVGKSFLLNTMIYS